MSVAVEQFQALIEKLESGLKGLSDKLNILGPRVESTADQWWVPGPVARGLIWLANKIVECISWIIEKIQDLLKGAVAPVILTLDAVDWVGEGIKGKATGVQSNTQRFNLTAPKQWTGKGATAYTEAVFPQSAAAAQVGSSATTIATALGAAAVAGLAFYGALGLFVAQLLPVLGFSVGAALSVVGFPAAGATTTAEATLGTGVIAGAVAALLAVLGAQGAALIAVTSEANEKGAFPKGGHWPGGTA